LRTSVTAFCSFEGGVYLIAEFLPISSFLFFVLFLISSFCCDMFIPECHQVKITENWRRFRERSKRKFLKSMSNEDKGSEKSLIKK